MKILATIFTGLLFASPVFAKSIAVTDLAYSETLQEYIHDVDYHNSEKVSASASSNSKARDYWGAASNDYSEAETAGSSSSESSRSRLNASSKTDFHEHEHRFSYVKYGELKKFTGDIKGALINSHQFTLQQAKPAPTKKDESVYNIIARIKKGDFPKADYVLFGRVSEMNFNDSTYQVDGGMINSILSLTLTAEFSLINTKTYEVKASFSAVGDGQDTKVLSPGTYAEPNRAAVVSQVSKSLGQDVFRQIEEQVFDDYSGSQNQNFDSRQNPNAMPPLEKPQGVTVFQ
jgi:hypothetical protein